MWIVKIFGSNDYNNNINEDMIAIAKHINVSSDYSLINLPVSAGLTAIMIGGFFFFQNTKVISFIKFQI